MIKSLNFGRTNVEYVLLKYFMCNRLTKSLVLFILGTSSVQPKPDLII